MLIKCNIEQDTTVQIIIKYIITKYSSVLRNSHKCVSLFHLSAI